MNAFTLTVPPRFDLDVAVRGHGWFDLPPFRYERSRRELRLAALLGGAAVELQVRHRSAGARSLEVAVAGDAISREVAAGVVSSCLRLGEDLGPLHRRMRREPRFRWAALRGAGRLLRAPTMWEDVVKMICTTNCSWALTRTMASTLVRDLGRPVAGAAREDGAALPRAFPTAEAVADAGEPFLRERARAGYRAPYLAELARRVAHDGFDLEALRRPGTPPAEIRRALGSIRGVGVYAIENLLRLLGHYDVYALDSWCRARYLQLYPRTRVPADRAIRRRYAGYAPWSGLALWLDLTRGWHEEREAVWP